MTVPKTSPGFWRSFDRDHEALPNVSSAKDSEGLKTTQHFGPTAKGFTCGTCEMPCHLEHHRLDWSFGGNVESPPVPELAWQSNQTQNIWVPRHGPAPYSSGILNKQLAGTVPVIELPDAVGVAESRTRRHYVHGIKTLEQGYGYRAECAVGDLYRYRLGECWHIPLCENCRKLFE